MTNGNWALAIDKALSIANAQLPLVINHGTSVFSWNDVLPTMPVTNADQR